MATRILSALFLPATLLALAAPPAWAQDASSPVPPAASDPKGATCINSGETYLEGDMACIAACHRERRLARCDVVAGIGKWTYVSESCPTTMINPPWPEIWSEPPAKVAMSPKPLNLDHSVPQAGIKLPVLGSVHVAAVFGG